MTQVLTAMSDEEMVDLIYDTRALIHGSFILSSGEPSSYYFDSKPLTLNPKGSYVVGRYLFDKLKNTDAESVGGMALGAIPIVGAVTLISHLEGEPLPAFFVRKEAKSHGTGKRIEGNLPDPGTPVAILDDVVTGGKSIMKAIRAAKSNGNPIAAVMCILDRNEGGRKYLSDEGHELQAMFTIVNGEIEFNP